MSVDFSCETPVSITEASAYVPGHPHVATLWRWILRGVRGVRLESFVRGGRRFTTCEAIERFIQATTAVSNSRIPRASTAAPASLSKARRQQLAAADAYCKAHGI